MPGHSSVKTEVTICGVQNQNVFWLVQTKGDYSRVNLSSSARFDATKAAHVASTEATNSARHAGFVTEEGVQVTLKCDAPRM
jgi:hypothetical protein